MSLSLQAITLTLSLLAIGLMLLYIAIQFKQVVLNRKYSIRQLFFRFREKMWMTSGLGLVFFGFYYFLVVFSSSKLDSQTKLAIFLDAYANPFEYVYFGLYIFIAISISLILIRTVIKYLYNTFYS